MLVLARDIMGAWRVRACLLLVMGAMFAAWANPITNHLGYGAALVAAIVCSLAAAIGASSFAPTFRVRGRAALGGDAVWIAIVWGIAIVGIAALIAAVGGALSAPCAPAGGLAFFALIPLPGAVLSSLVGLAIGAVVGRAWIATLLASALLPASIVTSLVRFYRTPTIFAYDPFFGFFPGAYFDETIRITPTLVTYRLGTVGAIVAITCAIAAAWLAPSARLKAAQVRAHLSLALGAAAGAMVAFAVYLAGPALGHRHDADDIARALGGRIEGRRCTVIYARTIAHRDAQATLADCAVRVGQLEQFFGVRVTAPITVFLFADGAQKQQLMGAADTYIAKPWRNEVYLQYAPFPHPVLKHELAHVVAGAMAGGPFHISVRAGLMPLPGLVEGAAVAAAWEGEGDSTPHQWSRAMLEAGLAPSVSTLAGLGFFTHAAGTAYTAAGSFSRWLIERYGTQRYQRVYRDGDFASAYGRPLDVLEREWHAFLRTVPISDRLLARARARFRRAALTARVCPHETAELFERGSARLAAGDLASARHDVETVVRNDPTDVRARTALAETLARGGDFDGALSLADAATRDLGPAAGARLRARAADLAWRWNRVERARIAYGSIDVELFDEDEARTMEVKRWALGLGPTSSDALYERAVQELLVGRGELEPDALAAIAMLLDELRARHREGPLDAPAAYLVARQLHARQRFAEAATMLGAIDLSQLPTTRIRAEAVRLRAVSLFLAGANEQALALFNVLADDASRPQGLRDTALDWADRVRRSAR